MEQPVRVRVRDKGRMVIPASFRAALGIRIGDDVEVRIENDELRISTIGRRLKEARRFVRKFVRPGRLLSEELIAERREAARRE